MAKANINYPLTGSFGGISIYRMKGSDKLIVRTKGGASKNKIKYDPAFEKVRLCNAEFGACGMAAGKIMRALLYIKHLSDHNVTGALVKISKIIQKMDTDSLVGQRALLFSKHKTIMGGFNLNRQHVFDSVVKHSPMYYFSRSELKVTLFLPELFPKINLLNPWNLGWYRIILVLGIIPDMAWDQFAYQQVNELVQYSPVKNISEWMETNVPAHEKIVTLQLSDRAFLDDSGSMVVSIGIEFGTMLTDTIIQPMKYAGCAKILGVG